MNNKINSFKINNKLAIILIFFFVFILASIRIIYLISDPYNTKKNKTHRYTTKKRLLFPKRGDIFDRNGNLLVSSIKVYQIDLDIYYLNILRKKYPKEINQKIKLFVQIIADNSSLSKKIILEKINNKFINLSNNISAKEFYNIKKNLGKNNLSKLLIGTIKTQKRFYAKDDFAKRLIGAVKKESGQGTENFFYDIRGISGIENLYEKDLAGKIGWEEYITKASNSDLYYQTYDKLQPEDGKNIYLTIDINLQEILQNNLTLGRKKFSAKKAIGLILDPNTGEILAMAEDEKDCSNMNNAKIRTLAPLAISFPFEPGSSVKPFIMQLALEKKLFSPKDSIDCRPYLYYSKFIKDHELSNYYSIPEIIIHSSNVGILKIAEKLGALNVYKRYKELGFGTKLSLNLPGNNSGYLKDIANWQLSTLGYHSFGQGFSCTALQLAMAFSSFANNGKIFRPLIVKKIVNKDKNKIEYSNPMVERNISKNNKIIDTLKDYLKDVVEYGTAVNTKKNYFYICGKTGTPENIKNNSYSPNFVGFFPAYSPKFLVVIAYIEPAHEYRYASNSSVITFSKIVDDIVKKDNYNLLLASKEFVQMPNLVGKSIKKAKKILSQKKINLTKYEDNDKDIIIKQKPLPGKFIRKNEDIQLILQNEAKTYVKK